MSARGNPTDAAPAALKPIQRLASNAGTDARAYASMFAQFALSTCGSHPLPRSVRPIGPRIAKSVLVLRGLVPPILTVCDLKELQTCPKADECRRLSSRISRLTQTMPRPPSRPPPRPLNCLEISMLCLAFTVFGVVDAGSVILATDGNRWQLKSG